MYKKERDPKKEAALIELRDQCTGTSGARQCQRLLLALEKFPVTTFEAMRLLDVYHVPARILQLRKRGVEILTVWTHVETEAGVIHRVGLYCLKKGREAVQPEAVTA